MGIPQSISTERRATKATLFYNVDELRSLHVRWNELVPPNHVIFEANFAAYCIWSSMCSRAETASVLFRAFDCQHRGYFDFEDFIMTIGGLTRGSTDQLSEVVFRMVGTPYVYVDDHDDDHIDNPDKKHDGDHGNKNSNTDNTTHNKKLAIVTTVQHNQLFTPPRSVYDGTPVAATGGPTQASPYHTADATVVRYDDVVQALAGLDATFLCLRCDGGVSAQSVAARLPFDEAGNLNFADLKKRVEQRL